MKTPIFQAIALNADITLRQAVLATKNRRDLLLYVDYTKGSETQLEITTEHSSEDEAGAEMWFTNSTVHLDHGANEGLVHVTPLNITASGLYRIPLSILPKEDQMRVTIAPAGTPDANSIINMWLVDDKNITA